MNSFTSLVKYLLIHRGDDGMLKNAYIEFMHRVWEALALWSPLGYTVHFLFMHFYFKKSEVWQESDGKVYIRTQYLALDDNCKCILKVAFEKHTSLPNQTKKKNE